MRLMRMTMLGIIVAIAGVGIALLASTESAQAEDAKGESTFEYVGSKSCKKCHSKTYKSWVETAHGKAFDLLKPQASKEAKEKHGLDAAKDYTKDDSCLKCHATGLGHAGGYSIPDAADEKAVKKAAKLAGVGCESCHGAGKEYAKVYKEIKKSKRKYKLAEVQAAGLTTISKETCTKCHNADSPTYDASAPFDFDKMKDKGIHEHEEMKQLDG